MGRYPSISPEIRALVYHKRGERIQDVIKETNVSRSEIYKIWKLGISQKKMEKGTLNVGGRPRKISDRQQRKMLRLVKTLRRQDPNWTVRRLMERADIMHVSRRTVTRLLNANGYKYLQARKKGLLSERDRKLRVKFAKHMIKDYPKDVWQTTIAFYFDAVGFIYKRNPCDQALAPSGKVWRTPSEGLAHGCTAKGQACGTG